MATDIDTTTLSTLDLLEARLLRIEHLLYGHVVQQPKTPAFKGMGDLEHHFAKLLHGVRVYAELLKIYKSHPDLFQPLPPSDPPTTHLPPDAIRAIVLAAAPSFPAAASALTTAVADTPVPDPALSASLAALLPRMRGVEVTQRAQAAEIAELRARSEVLVRRWYEGRVLATSEFVARVEGRVERAEMRVRRAERVRDEV
ncbi:hypothetical protein MGN70_013246 [Eutypa lata]|uniref:Putative nuclear distribution protein n=1 Tax=Eutypa lata (strain UCR-EL1) TaxID=1287681 RepID=M7SNR6_EUTLA|nr:putative nuclear distribution protein [Eutypa lata UCREL1]KAI1246347.1 hypothetical protein MGN70_013246 [Eutypa lata]